MSKNILKIMVVIIIVLIGLSAWFWWRNIYSRDVLKLEILAASEAEAGQQIDYIIRYKNNGSTRLENPRLVFEFPENTVMAEELRSSEDDRIILRGVNRVEVGLDEISPGEERTEELTGYIFGREGATATAKATMYFKPKNLNVEYDAETTHTIQITGVPITFDFHLPSRVDAEKEFSFDINYYSRIDYPISNLRVKIDYPSEFAFSQSRPSPSFEDSEWEIGVLNKNEGARIEISGSLKGEPSQIRVFRANLGFWQDDRFVLLKESTRGTEIATPLLYITYRINEKVQHVASPGEYLHYEIFFRNTGNDPLENLFMTVKLDRDLLDFDRVQIEEGVFQRGTGTIIWDSKDISELGLLSPMQEGKVSFWAKVKDDVEKINPEIEVETSLSQIRKRITTKVNTEMTFSQGVFFGKGPFDNYGPQPPRAGFSTSYTVNWKIKNTSSEVKDLKAVATLPQGVRLSGEIYPDDAQITFDSGSREVVWNIESISPQSEKETYFQIIFDPTSEQRGDTAELISEAVAIGRDGWTDLMVRKTSPSRSTDLPDDESISEETGIVE